MFELAQQLTYYASYVDGGASSAIVNLGMKLASVGSIATAAQASLSGLVAPMNEISAAWSTREQQINNIARSLRQYEYVGQSITAINADITRSMPGATQAEHAQRFTQVYNDQFQQARVTTRAVLHEINQLAAQLPGESADYIMTLSQSLPFMSQRRGGMQLREAVRLSSYLAAGGIAGGIDAGQTSRDLMQFLTTGPHMVDRSWTEVWSQYATYKGRRVGADQIRGMDVTKRLEVLSNIANQLKPMMDATSESYEATMGTLTSFRHEMFLTATEPIFEAWKHLLTRVNSLLAEYAGLLSGAVRFIGEGLAKKLDSFATSLGDAQNWLKLHTVEVRLWFYSVINTISSVANFFKDLAAPLMHAGGGLASFVGGFAKSHEMDLGGTALTAAAPMIATGLLDMMGIALGPIGGFIFAAIIRSIMSNAGTYMAAFTMFLMEVVPPLVLLAGTLFRMYDAVMRVVDVFLVSLLPPAIEILGAFIGMVVLLVQNVISIIGNVIMGLLFPFVLSIGLAFQGLGAILDIAAVGFSLITGLFTAFSGQTFDLIDAFRQLGDFLKEVGQDLRESVAYLLHEMGSIDDSQYSQRMASIHGGNENKPQWVTNLEAYLNNLRNQTGNLDNHGQGPPNRPHTTNDFRYSRFDITQAFAEGFSPDRVASAFVSDLESMAEQRLSSGFAPAYTLP